MAAAAAVAVITKKVKLTTEHETKEKQDMFFQHNQFNNRPGIGLQEYKYLSQMYSRTPRL